MQIISFLKKKCYAERKPLCVHMAHFNILDIIYLLVIFLEFPYAFFYFLKFSYRSFLYILREKKKATKVFSLSFSSAGKGPFMAGKAKVCPRGALS